MVKLGIQTYYKMTVSMLMLRSQTIKLSDLLQTMKLPSSQVKITLSDNNIAVTSDLALLTDLLSLMI